MTNITTRTFLTMLGISFALHGVVLVTLHHNKKTTNISEEIGKELYVNLSPVNIESTAATKRKKLVTQQDEKKSTQKVIERILNEPISVEKKPPEEKNITETSDKIQNKNHDKINQIFYTLLNSAINRNKHYPRSAHRRNQQGTVRVSFRLLNNGQINDIDIANSSGYQSLDKAALNAVQKIQPFTPAKDYIAVAKSFNIDIIFKL